MKTSNINQQQSSCLTASAWGILLATASVILTNILAPSHYETNDDVSNTLLLSGIGLTDVPEYHFAYSSVLLTYVLKCLYQAFPHFPWYGGYLFSALTIGLSVIAAVFVQRFGSLIGCLAFAAFYVTTGVFVVNNLQFTSAAALLTQSGVIVALSALRLSNRAKLSSLAFAGVVVTFASLMRTQSALLITAIGTATFFVSTIGKLTYPRIVGGCLWFVLVAASSSALDLVNERLYESDRSWREVPEFIKSAIPIPDYRSIRLDEQTLRINGLTPNDVELMGHFFFADQLFSNSVIRQLRGTSSVVATLPPADEVAFLVHRLLQVAAFGAAIFFLLDASLLSKERLAVCLTGVSVLLILLELYAKLPLRVFLSVQVCVASTLILFVNEQKVRKLITLYLRLPTKMKSATVVIGCLTLAFGCRYYKQRLLIPSQIAVDQNLVLKSALRDLASHQGKLYVVMTPGLRYELMSPLDDLTKYFAGVDIYKTSFFSHSPIGANMLERHHVKNILDALTSNEGLLVAEPGMVDLYTVFVREHYGQKLSFELVAARNDIGLHVYKVVSMTPKLPPRL